MENVTREREIIGAKIRAARRLAGYTQSEAAAKLDLTQSHLSMLEMGKRRLSAELADKMFLLYGAESEAIFSDEDGEALAEKTVKILKAFAEKSGDEGVMRAVNNYISLCGYLMLRNLYLVNPYNSEKIFSVGGGELDDLTDFLFHEPQSIALSAVHSGRVKACSIEPDDIESVTFLQIIRACEDIIKHGKTDFK